MPAVANGGREVNTTLGTAQFGAHVGHAWRESQHWNSNLVLTGDGDAATGLCYIMRVVKMKDTGASVANVVGMYEDRMVKANGHWLFKVRKVTQDTLPPSAIPQPE